MLSWIRGKPTEMRYSRSASVQEQLFKASIRQAHYTDITLFYIDFGIGSNAVNELPKFVSLSRTFVLLSTTALRNEIPYRCTVNQ